MPMELFVSYNREDQDAVDEVVARLRRERYDVWTDREL
jgi:hypothetical protein